MTELWESHSVILARNVMKLINVQSCGVVVHMFRSSSSHPNYEVCVVGRHDRSTWTERVAYLNEWEDGLVYQQSPAEF